MHEPGGSTILARARRAASLPGPFPPQAPEPDGETAHEAMAKTPPDRKSQTTEPGGATEQARGKADAPVRSRSPESAFDLWLQRELQKMFSDVAREPVPEELIRLIDRDKLKRK